LLVQPKAAAEQAHDVFHLRVCLRVFALAATETTDIPKLKRSRKMQKVLGLMFALPSAIALSTSTCLAAVETYKVDPVHSSVIYKIRHMNTTNFYGRFDDLQGTVVLDEAAPESGSINLEIKTDSLDSGNPKRDQHLKSPDFFNVAQFPTITFKSTSIKKAGDKQLNVTGDLNLHGVTKPVTAKVELIGKGKGPRGNEIAGGEASFLIKRSEFGMSFMPQGLGEDVSVTVAIEAARQQGQQAGGAPAAGAAPPQ
jgi:polyisoprenoid-binding protein YceI